MRTYLTPAFPQTAAIYSFNGIVLALRQNVMCDVRCMTHNGDVLGLGITLNQGVYPVMFYFPIGTDVRDPTDNGGLRDFIEMPRGSQSFYPVISVNDQAKGFPNAFRTAYAYHAQTGFPPVAQIRP